MRTKNASDVIRRCAILLAASFALVILFWFAYGSVDHMADLQLIGFEREPSEGLDHWRWFFIKQDLSRVLSAIAIPIAFAMVVIWKWTAFARDIVRGRGQDHGTFCDHE